MISVMRSAGTVVKSVSSAGPLQVLYQALLFLARAKMWTFAVMVRVVGPLLVAAPGETPPPGARGSVPSSV